MEDYSMTALFNISGAWTDYWSAALLVNDYLIVDPNSRPPDLTLVVMYGWFSIGSEPLRVDVHL
jgi:hypothetical protein